MERERLEKKYITENDDVIDNEKVYELRKAEQYFKREADWKEANERAKGTSERVYCRIHQWHER